MIDRYFAPVLTFILLIAATVLLAGGLFGQQPARDVRVAQGMSRDVIVLEEVIVIGKRDSAEPAVGRASQPVAANSTKATGADARGLLLHRARD